MLINRAVLCAIIIQKLSQREIYPPVFLNLPNVLIIYFMYCILYSMIFFYFATVFVRIVTLDFQTKLFQSFGRKTYKGLVIYKAILRL